MNPLKVISCVAVLTVTMSSTAFAGTIVGARTSRTGTIVGARSGNIAGTRTHVVDTASLGPGTAETKLALNSLISENIDGLLRLFLARALF